MSAYEEDLSAGACKTSLQRLAGSYGRLEASARKFSHGGSADSYATAAGAVTPSLEAAQRACHTKP